MRALGLGLIMIGGMAMAGCETFDDYVVSSETGETFQGAVIRLDRMETFAGDRYDQFRAWNGGSRTVCAQVVFVGSNNYTGSGYSMGTVYSVAPGSTMDIGYVQYPASYESEGRLWSPQANGACGSYQRAARR